MTLKKLLEKPSDQSKDFKATMQVLEVRLIKKINHTELGQLICQIAEADQITHNILCDRGFEIPAKENNRGFRVLKKVTRRVYIHTNNLPPSQPQKNV